MNSSLISAIHDFTLWARHKLQDEVSNQLEGIYGWLPNGSFEPEANYCAIREIPEAKSMRRSLEQLVEQERSAQVSAVAARKELVKEAAFTWLNRLVAFRMMEERKIIPVSLSDGKNSRGYLFWLYELGNEALYELHESGDFPLNDMGEGPRDISYRRYLLYRCSELAKEIRVLFDVEAPAGRLTPRPRVLTGILERMNAEQLKEAWASGNEETIGWVYQYFNEPDLEIFRSRRAPKVPPHLIAAKTQQFTPRWIVKFLVHNSLGRTWLQMHPDSALAKDIEYLVPLQDEVPSASLKPVREITLLDPACGAMHFGLVAFDLFVKMYREEIVHAGEPGWPQEPSVEHEEDIPASIIANNIYGIDIDLRAVQLSAITLYLKAKTLNRSASITESNLVCTDIVLHNGNKRLEEFLKEMAFTRPVYERIICAVWSRLKDANQLGSLLRLEEEIHALVENERRAVRRDKSTSPLFLDKEKFADAYSDDESYFDILDVQIVQAFDEFARRQATERRNVTLFAAEAVKGMKLLDVMLRKYDIVTTNPPYLDGRDYNDTLKPLLESSYPDTKRNLYSAFLERCIEFQSDGARLGIITPQTFMFISSFVKTRQLLQENIAIETLVHTGLNTFNDAVVDIAFYVLRKEKDEGERNKTVGTYFRLVREKDGDSKRRRFEEALENLRAGREDQVIYKYSQCDFDAISGSPWVYWITMGLRSVFAELPKIGENAQPRVGLQTGDNVRFLRFWWETGTSNVGFGYSSAMDARDSGKRWVPYMKGGAFQRWYGNQKHLLNWKGDGREVKGFIPRAVVRNEGFYFRRGVTYSYLTSSRFSARLSPGGFIFDVAGSSLFPEDIELILAIMNSSFAAYALKLINPTVNFQVGDLARLPVPKVSSETLQTLVGEAIALSKTDCMEAEITYDFVVPPAWRTGIEDVAARHTHLSEIEQEIDEEVFRLYGISDEDRLAIERELADTTESEEVNGKSKRGRKKDDGELTQEKLAGMWISYAIGVVLGRFQLGVEGDLGRGNFSSETSDALKSLATDNGICIVEEGHTTDLPALVWRALELMVGEDEVIPLVRAALGEKGIPEELLRNYLSGKFFDEHITQYKKAPVYWFLQSPDKKFGIWLFHERLSGDTLSYIQSTFVEPRISKCENDISRMANLLSGLDGGIEREIRRQISPKEDLLEDLKELRKLLNGIIGRGYTPHLDDGVKINMCLLFKLIATPKSYRKLLKETWEKLEEGDYDWAHTAMDYWPKGFSKRVWKTSRTR